MYLLFLGAAVVHGSWPLTSIIDKSLLGFNHPLLPTIYHPSENLFLESMSSHFVYVPHIDNFSNLMNFTVFYLHAMNEHYR